MTKAELLNAVAASAGVSKADAERVIDAFFGTVKSSAKGGDKVTWPGFGSFSMATTKARETRVPSTGEIRQTPAKKKVKFTQAAALKLELNPSK